MARRPNGLLDDSYEGREPSEAADYMRSIDRIRAALKAYLDSGAKLVFGESLVLMRLVAALDSGA